MAGPANAIRKAAFGVFASPWRVVTPPKSHNVTSPTLTPMRRATTACASSCANNDASNTSAPHAPASQYARCEYPLTVSGSVLARLHVNNHRITITLQWTFTGNPATRPSGMASLTSSLRNLLVD